MFCIFLTHLFTNALYVPWQKNHFGGQGSQERHYKSSGVRHLLSLDTLVRTKFIFYSKGNVTVEITWHI